VHYSELGTRLGGHSELGAPALLKAVWWGMRLASVLTHLFLIIGQLSDLCLL